MGLVLMGRDVRVWLDQAKSYTCDALKPVNKNRQGEVRFTFDVAKCDKIFDELYKIGYVKITHVIPPLDELKRRAYCGMVLTLMQLMIVMFFCSCHTTVG